MTIIIIVSGVNFTNKGNNRSHNQENIGYILREYNGKIAVFKQDGSTLIEVFDVEFSSLPASDRQLLLKGIKADNIKKIYQIAEDFDG